MGSSRKEIIVSTLFLLSFSLLLCSTFAASGGRMGGDSFSKRSSSSSSSSRSKSSNYVDDHHYYHHHHHYDSREYSSKSSSKDQMGEGRADDGSPGWIDFSIFFGILAVLFWLCYIGAKNDEKGSVIMVQVGLTGKATSLKKELNKIAKTTDTSSSEGWNLILEETVIALLRHKHYFISGYSYVNVHGNAESLEKKFKELSLEEREKIDIESLVNVNNFKGQRAVIPNPSKLGKDFIVVTVLIAAKGAYNFLAIKSIDDLKNVLQCLKFPSKKLLAVEVLWTPQDESDTLSEEELLEDYPLLRPI